MYRNLLLPVDLTDTFSWTRALPVSLSMIKAFGGRLNIMTVIPDFGMSIVGGFFPRDFADQAMRKATDALQAFVHENVPEAVDIHHIVARGTVYKEIMVAAKVVEADLIVMAAHGPGMEDFLLGPNAARVVRHSRCSVMIVRD